MHAGYPRVNPGLRVKGYPRSQAADSVLAVVRGALGKAQG